MPFGVVCLDHPFIQHIQTIHHTAIVHGYQHSNAVLFFLSQVTLI